MGNTMKTRSISRMYTILHPGLANVTKFAPSAMRPEPKHAINATVQFGMVDALYSGLPVTDRAVPQAIRMKPRVLLRLSDNHLKFHIIFMPLVSIGGNQ